jgi:hypothetical protein
VRLAQGQTPCLSQSAASGALLNQVQLGPHPRPRTIGRVAQAHRSPASLDFPVPTFTTFAGAQAAVEGIAALQQQRQVEVIALQDIYEPWGGLSADIEY